MKVIFSIQLGREFKEEEVNFDFDENTSEHEITKEIQECYEDWVWGKIDSTWYIEEEEE